MKKHNLLPHNQAMQDFLRQHGIEAIPKYLDKGSLRGTWRLYNPDLKWSLALAHELNAIGFSNPWGEPLDQYGGNGGMFSCFVLSIHTAAFLKESQPVAA